MGAGKGAETADRDLQEGLAVVGSTGADEVEAGNGRLIVEHVDDPVSASAEDASSDVKEPAAGAKKRKQKGSSRGKRFVGMKPLAGG